MANKQSAVSLAVQSAISVAVKHAKTINKVFGTMRSKVIVELQAVYPSKAEYMAADFYPVHSAFMRELRTRSEDKTKDNKNTDQYAFARAWLIETYGGLRNKEGTGFKSATRESQKIPPGVYLRTFSVKLESMFTYIDKAPLDGIEPAMLAELRAECERAHALFTKLEAYREQEKAAAESDAALAKAKEKAAKEKASVAKAKAKAAVVKQAKAA
jgi:hypothetical protein